MSGLGYRPILQCLDKVRKVRLGNIIVSEWAGMATKLVLAHGRAFYP